MNRRWTQAELERAERAVGLREPDTTTYFENDPVQYRDNDAQWGEVARHSHRLALLTMLAATFMLEGLAVLVVPQAAVGLGVVLVFSAGVFYEAIRELRGGGMEWSVVWVVGAKAAVPMGEAEAEIARLLTEIERLKVELAATTGRTAS